MKKLTMLTSCLALTACFGGGGNGVTSGAPARSAVTADAIASNQNITSMSSEILVDNTGNSSARSATRSHARSGSIVQDGKTYTQYRLEDVTFKMGGEDSRIIFDVDNEGRIIALGKYDRSDNFTGNPTYALSEEGKFVRQATSGTDSNKFSKILYMYGVNGTALDYTNGVAQIASDHFKDGIEFMNDNGNLSAGAIRTALKTKLRKEINKIKASQKDADANDENYVTLHASYVANLHDLEDAYDTYAQRIDAMTSFNPGQAAYTDVVVEGVNIGLKYADLGFAELTAKANPTDPLADAIEHTFTPYVGGYDTALKINQANLDENREFTGTAIAGIDHKRKGYTDGKNVEEGVLVRQDNAKLTLNKDGTSRLVMNNLLNQDPDHATEHWYAVQVDTDVNGRPTYTITGSNTITGKHTYTGTDGDGINAYDLPDAAHLVGTSNATTFAANQWEAHEQNYVDHSDTNYRISGNYENSVYRQNNDNAHAEATALFNFANEYHSNDNSKHNEVAIYGAFGSGTSAVVINVGNNFENRLESCRQ